MRAGRLAGLVVGGLLLTPGAALASSACPGDEQIPTAATASDAAAALVCDINVFRGNYGLGPVRLDSRLQSPAQDLASDMAAHHFLSHVSSDGRTARDRMTAAGYIDGTSDALVLENVDWGNSFYASPLATAFGWMKSDSHREHMLDPSMQDVGVGIAFGPMQDGGAGGVFYVADFGMRAAQQASSSTRPQACRSRKRTRHRVRRHARRIHHKRCGS